ncbi:2,5-diamino-6-hydroxy-4-(5-phosphoribosylamino) pyrimidine 1-reductase [Desulfurobacterium thermolithotrophum DSM 11699]|uniref:2,5-diamino-6-(ribosylamino)-4(3H)-pyrimidinone 5'-phosphate reductase n=1 Tax=Desulfurobacterium thermolithotrophum (strain DSM 11699 / BSA) TaxID=868864 RepID=F0S329_DESTD|nr:2,5-diamino-6-(ribosylamino)-4(3H)-pyrimidinone 5'-phosphate reductase [Desulfurobacterium thermolithotrophum]ADY73251.1 2,5-diamino-6-hydroxy-4-(5-phosphoribosylamino) pyrimidine 1-reductase [Desulfurobacterium thermolithotrophum DSM 11699]
MERPYVIIVSEVTIDGKLTLAKGVSSKEIMKLMDEEANKYLHQIRAECDGIMVGANTIRIDNPNLTVRYVKGKNPTRIIPVSTGDIPLDANILNTEVAPTVIAVSKKAPAEKIEKLKEKGVQVIVAGNEKVDFAELFSKLYEMGIRKLMVEGGSKVNWELIKNDLIDEIRLIHLPVVVGGDDVPSLVSGEGFKTLDAVKRFEIKKVFKCGNQIVTEYGRK